MEYILTADSLCKHYRHFRALNNFSIHVPKGSIYGIVGKNGAGKTTLLRLICGLQDPSSGSYELYGVRDTDSGINRCRRRMGAVIETPSIYMDMTAEANLKEQFRIIGLPDFDSIPELLKLVGLEKAGKKKARHFSLGMRQRLGIAVALAGAPDFLVLDEPINGLDPAGIIEVRTLLQNLNEEENMTIVLSSHILAELEHIATHYGFLAHGKLVREISAESLHDQCADYIALTVSDTDEYAALFARTCPDEQLQVMPDGVLRIFAPRRPAAFYSKLATENGITILGMQTVQGSLEDYYMALRQEAGAQ